MASDNTLPVTRVEDLAARILASASTDSRKLVGICGAPGSGKSTLADAVASHLNAKTPGSCAIVPMDGFHLDNAVLSELGLLSRKGSPETFDVGGLVDLHRRLHANAEDAIAVPVFDRRMDLSRACARMIQCSAQIVLVEGNYLLLQRERWQDLAAFYDLTVGIGVTEKELERRLMARWLGYGLPHDEARAKVTNNDLPNAELVIAHSRDPDIVFSNE